MTSGGFAARAQAAGDRNTNAATSSGQGTQNSAAGQTGTGGGSTGSGRGVVSYSGWASREPGASQKK